MIYYIPVFFILILSILLFWKKDNFIKKIILIINFFIIISLVYSFVLGFYFKSYFLGEMRGSYPSVVMSSFFYRILLYAIIPMNILYFFVRFYYWIKKER